MNNPYSAYAFIDALGTKARYASSLRQQHQESLCNVGRWAVSDAIMNRDQYGGLRAKAVSDSLLISHDGCEACGRPFTFTYYPQVQDSQDTKSRLSEKYVIYQVLVRLSTLAHYIRRVMIRASQGQWNLDGLMFGLRGCISIRPYSTEATSNEAFFNQETYDGEKQINASLIALTEDASDLVDAIRAKMSGSVMHEYGDFIKPDGSPAYLSKVPIPVKVGVGIVWRERYVVNPFFGMSSKDADRLRGFFISALATTNQVDRIPEGYDKQCNTDYIYNQLLRKNGSPSR